MSGNVRDAMPENQATAFSRRMPRAGKPRVRRRDETGQPWRSLRPGRRWKVARGDDCLNRSMFLQGVRLILGTQLDGHLIERTAPFQRSPMKIISAKIIAATIGLGGLLAISACNRQETPSETRKDVAEAQREGNQEVAEQTADARSEAAENREDIAKADDSAEVREARSDAMKENADANQDVADAKAKADYEVAKEKCESLPAAQQDGCKNAAEATYDAAKARAEQSKDATKDAAGR